MKMMGCRGRFFAAVLLLFKVIFVISIFYLIGWLFLASLVIFFISVLFMLPFLLSGKGKK